LLVELGTHWGESYFGFCQAIAENQLPCVTYAVDTWTGEQQSGFYDETVYKDVAAYNETNYKDFSYLVRSLFDSALPQFADESIDILHIDGLHTFEAVSHDFYSWLPKVKPGGIVLLHDIAARHADFGVWKVWNELKTKGATFEFHHSWGLGVFEKPSRGGIRPPFLDALLGGDTTKQEHIRRFYSLAAAELAWKNAAENSAPGPRNQDHAIQVFRPLPEGYIEHESQKASIRVNEWQHVTVELPFGLMDGSLRIDLSDCPAIIDIRGLTIRSAFDHQILWSSNGSDLATMVAGGTLVHLGPELGNGACRFFSYGSDPQLYLPVLASPVFDQPVSLEIWLRLRTELDELATLLVRPAGPENPSTEEDHAPDQRAELMAQVDALRAERDLLTAEKDQRSNQCADLMAQVDTLRTERDQLLKEVNKKQTQLYLLRDCNEAYSELERKHSELERTQQELSREYSQACVERNRLQATLSGVLSSRSWRLTEPLRQAMRMLKRP
jgi:outer membrane murein-binding lipoprotein Lpp